MKSLKRRQFFRYAVATSAAGIVLPSTTFATPRNLEVPQIELDVVKEFVGKSHGSFDTVKALVKEYPHIINACWDWGDGDYETGIGAAGHVGNVDIANFLIEKGARPDIFVLTMLGKTKIVKAILEEYPDLIHALGPHGFTLLHHARKGGKAAADLTAFFEAKGMTETIVKIYKKE